MTKFEITASRWHYSKHRIKSQKMKGPLNTIGLHAAARATTAIKIIHN